MFHIIKQGLEQNVKFFICFILLDNPLLIVRPPGKSYPAVSFMKCIKPVQNSYSIGVRSILTCSWSYSFKPEWVVIHCANSQNISVSGPLILVFEKKSCKDMLE